MSEAGYGEIEAGDDGDLFGGYVEDDFSGSDDYI